MFAVSRSCARVMRFGEALQTAVIRSCALKSEYKRVRNLEFSKTINFQRTFCSSVVDSSGSHNKQKELNYEAITNGDKELEHKLKVIILEGEVMRQEGKPVPENEFMTVEQWKELLVLPSRTARRKYFEFLFKLSKKKENRKIKKLEKQQERGEKPVEEKKNETLEDHALNYGLQYNNIFLRIYDTTINQFYNNRLVQAMQFGQKLVVDCGYDQNMTKRENANCGKQLMLMFAENRNHDDPFDLHFCSTNAESVLMKTLNKYIPTADEPWFPLNKHESSYLDCFPKEQLIYLTPHCREEMVEFDHNAVYIIGAIVDKINNEPLSLAKAKREGIKMAKFPLDRYLQWGAGSGKSLTLNQCLLILLDIKTTGDWNYALRHVPRRKVVDFNIESNVNKATDSLRFDRPIRERKWVPSGNIGFKKVQYNNKKNKDSKIINMKNIFNE